MKLNYARIELVHAETAGAITKAHKKAKEGREMTLYIKCYDSLCEGNQSL